MGSKGFITIGIDTDVDNVKYSYALALSIKGCDPKAEICLVVDKGKSNLVNKKYLHAFDYITELPFGNTAHKDGFHGANFWQLLQCTPFDETIYLDYDTILLNIDLPLLWDMLEFYDVAVPSYAKTFRGIPLNLRSLFEIESAYGLPHLFNNMFYFKRESKLAIEWFKMADAVFQNWRDVYTDMFKDKKPMSFNKNVLANAVTYLLDVEKDVAVHIFNLYDLDNRSQWFWNEDVPADWTKMLNSWYTDDNCLIIENSMISNGIIHYRDENFLTLEITDVITAKLNNSSK
jgi:hypothetical protein